MNNNIEIGEKYLPIGTVVMLKGGKKRAMITGFCSIPKEDSKSMYDYSGCIYPEGFVSSDVVCLFNHDQIEHVYFKGFVDEEEIRFKENLNELLKKLSTTNDNASESNNIQNYIQPSNSNLQNSITESVPLASQAPLMPDE